MTYLQIVSLIRGICETVNPNGTFIHGRRLDGSLSYGDKYPVILLEPVTDTIDTTNDIEVANISMGFMMKDTQESSLAKQEVLIGQADVLRRAFQDLIKVESIDVSIFRGTPFYRIFAGVNTGYLLTFTITSKTVTCE